jgi:hypothetical protein
VNVHIDQAGADDHAGGIEYLRRLQSRLRPDAEDLFAANPKVGDFVETLRRIDDAAVSDA